MVSYKDPNYVRTRTLRAALQAIDGCAVIDATNKRSGWSRYLETITKTLLARVRHNPDVYVLGFRGHDIFWIVRLLTLGKRLVFDAFISPSDALISEGKLGSLGRLLGYVIYPFEYLCLRFSNHCITDTQCHRQFIAQQFRIAKNKFEVVYVGATPDEATADPDVDSPVDQHSGILTVLFYGTFLPLHGMDVMLQSCKILEDKPIEFHFIGGKGTALAEFQELLRNLDLGNIRHKTWVDFEDLKLDLIPRADLCLGGPFGGTPQARRVISGKTFQFLMQGKATVVGRIDEQVGFIDRTNCLLVEQANPESLANVFEWALANRNALGEIGRQGQVLFRERFSVECLANQLESAVRGRP